MSYLITTCNGTQLCRTLTRESCRRGLITFVVNTYLYDGWNLILETITHSNNTTILGLSMHSFGKNKRNEI